MWFNKTNLFTGRSLYGRQKSSNNISQSLGQTHETMFLLKITSASSLTVFQNQLKTYLFSFWVPGLILPPKWHILCQVERYNSTHAVQHWFDTFFVESNWWGKGATGMVSCLTFEPAGSINHKVCEAWPVWHQTYDYLPTIPASCASTKSYCLVTTACVRATLPRDVLDSALGENQK